MKLLSEVVDSVNIISEATGNAQKGYFIEGIFLQGDIENKNGRVYPCDILDPEVEKYIKEYVNKNRAYGELGHPSNPNINLDRVSHMITELTKDGKNWRGKAKIVNTPCGKIVQSLMEAGASLGVSSRSLGSLKPEGNTNIVQNDLKIMTAADIVADPSAPEAFVESIMEDNDWMVDSAGNWIPMLETYKKRIKEASSKNLQEEKLRVFQDFFSKLK